MSIIGTQITSFMIVYSTVYPRRRSKKTSKLCITGLCEGNSPVTSEFSAQRTCKAENVSMWWCHHVIFNLNSICFPVSCFPKYSLLLDSPWQIYHILFLFINHLVYKVNWLADVRLILYHIPVSIIFVSHNEICQAVLAILSTSIARDMTGSWWIVVG